MTLLHRACVSLYWYFNDTMSACRTFLRYSASKNGVTLKLGVGVVQDHRQTIYDFLLVGHCKYNCSLYVVPYSSYLTLNNHDLENVTEGHSNWYHSKALVWFLIRLP